MSIICPICEYSRSWQLRRNKRKCKRCHHEFSKKLYFKIPGIRATEKEWRDCISVFLKERTVKRITAETGIGHCRVEKMVKYIRNLMFEYSPPPFSGITEIDETYIGGQRKNKKLHIRRLSLPKSGHGTEKLPIIGLFNRDLSRVYVTVLVREKQKRKRERKKMHQVFGIIKTKIVEGSTVYTDSYKLYDSLSKFHNCKHESVNHYHGEYSRGTIHTNNIEGFWGILKRKLGCIGGMRRNNLKFFVAEIVWKFNHRKLSFDVQTNIILDKIR